MYTPDEENYKEEFKLNPESIKDIVSRKTITVENYDSDERPDPQSLFIGKAEAR